MNINERRALQASDAGRDAVAGLRSAMRTNLEPRIPLGAVLGAWRPSTAAFQPTSHSANIALTNFQEAILMPDFPRLPVLQPDGAACGLTPVPGLAVRYRAAFLRMFGINVFQGLGADLVPVLGARRLVPDGPNSRIGPSLRRPKA